MGAPFARPEQSNVETNEKPTQSPEHDAVLKNIVHEWMNSSKCGAQPEAKHNAATSHILGDFHIADGSNTNSFKSTDGNPTLKNEAQGQTRPPFDQLGTFAPSDLPPSASEPFKAYESLQVQPTAKGQESEPNSMYKVDGPARAIGSANDAPAATGSDSTKVPGNGHGDAGAGAATRTSAPPDSADGMWHAAGAPTIVYDPTSSKKGS